MSPANSESNKRVVTVLPGDGIGPECVFSALRIIEATGVDIEWDMQEAGGSVFRQGIASGVPPATIESINKTRVVLKGPLDTPVGSGEMSANVTLRKLFETHGNLRPVRELPGVRTPYSGRGIDFVVVRENVEDVYAGIEYMQTPGVAQGLKLISRKGCEKVVRLAFELARAEGREIVHCATKSNIMKLTEGMMKRTFEDVATEYPDIESTHIIVDNCAHQLVKRPEQFDIIVTTNMNGDILSDLASALIGGLGYAPSANIGNEVAIFEAVHGTAPKYAGKNVINPTAVIMSATMMLRHIGEFDAASSIEHAVLLNLEEGKYLTRDIVGDERNASTTEYTDAIIDKLGRKAQQWQVRDYKPIKVAEVSQDPDLVKATHRKSVGLDLFIESGLNAEQLGQSVESLTAGSPLELKMISNRGTKVYPASGAMTDCVDHWRCRFLIDSSNGEMTNTHVIDLLTRIEGHYRWIHLEKLEEIDGELGFTRAQGED